MIAREYTYSPLDMAWTIRSLDLGAKETVSLLNNVWEDEQKYLIKKYRDSLYLWITDCEYWGNYINDKEDLDTEFPSLRQDIIDAGRKVKEDDFLSDFTDLDFFFKRLRIQILYVGQHDYVRVKLRTLLKAYGYKRRSPQILRHINDCMKVYHLKPFMTGGEACQIGKIDINDMITFRLCQ